MPSERDGWRRLHPYTLIFALARHAYASRAVLLPALVALGLSQRRAASGGWQDFQLWLLLPVPLLLVYELVQYLTLAYRFDEHDIVVTRGLYWKRERHIPYARVQNIELVQHWGHRLAGVAKVRLDTGTGADADAELSVLSLEAVQQLRDAVREGRRGTEPPGAEAAAAGPAVLVALGPRELALHGLLTARGLLVIGALAGLLWQGDLDWWGLEGYLPSARGVWGRVVSATPGMLLEILLLAAAVVLMLRVLSAAWSVVKHFDFSLVARGPELFQSYGLLTRVGRTIPRARIQKLTITDTPWMRLLRRATLSVDTAAVVSAHEQQAIQGSQVLVPIVPAARVPALVRDVHPTGATSDLTDLAALDWQGVHPRTFRRLLRVRLVAAAIAGLVVRGPSGSWVWAAAAGVAVAAIWIVQARREARVTAFAWSGDTLLFRSGAWTRHVSLVRTSRVQVVSLIRSPFDRRWGMARVHVDTAGAAGGGHHVHIPWLTDGVADALYARLRNT